MWPRGPRPAAARLRDFSNFSDFSSRECSNHDFDGQLKDCAPPEPDEVELEERKGMAMGGVPEPYLDAWARLQCQKPVRVSDAEWRQAIDDAGKFLDAWKSLALELQWTAGELFDCPRDGKSGGLVWFQKGECVRGLGPEHAVLGVRVYDRIERGEWVFRG